MPFASKFCAMMQIPLPGERIGDLVVESLEARDVPGGPGQHAYAVTLVLRGPGGRESVRRALGALLSAQPLAFSAYGNPYQLFCGKPEVQALSSEQYQVRISGAGMRIDLEEQLVRFATHMRDAGVPNEDLRAQVQAYLAGYMAEQEKGVNRYRGRLRRRQAALARSQGRKSQTPVPDAEPDSAV